MDRNFAWIFVAIGLWFLIRFSLNLRKAKRAENWPTMDGVITQSQISIQRSRDSDDGRVSNLYGALVRYSYRVKGEEYSGDRIAFVDVHTGDEERARDILARYPLGAAVRVFYNPADPQNAMLEPGVNQQAFVPFLIPLVFLVIGIVVLLSPGE